MSTSPADTHFQGRENSKTGQTMAHDDTRLKHLSDAYERRPDANIKGIRMSPNIIRLKPKAREFSISIPFGDEINLSQGDYVDIDADRDGTLMFARNANPTQEEKENVSTTRKVHGNNQSTTLTIQIPRLLVENALGIEQSEYDQDNLILLEPIYEEGEEFFALAPLGYADDLFRRANHLGSPIPGSIVSDIYKDFQESDIYADYRDEYDFSRDSIRHRLNILAQSAGKETLLAGGIPEDAFAEPITAEVHARDLSHKVVLYYFPATFETRDGREIDAFREALRFYDYGKVPLAVLKDAHQRLATQIARDRYGSLDDLPDDHPIARGMVSLAVPIEPEFGNDAKSKTTRVDTWSLPISNEALQRVLQTTTVDEDRLIQALQKVDYHLEDIDDEWFTDTEPVRAAFDLNIPKTLEFDTVEIRFAEQYALRDLAAEVLADGDDELAVAVRTAHLEEAKLRFNQEGADEAQTELTYQDPVVIRVEEQSSTTSSDSEAETNSDDVDEGDSVGDD